MKTISQVVAFCEEHAPQGFHQDELDFRQSERAETASRVFSLTWDDGALQVTFEDAIVELIAFSRMRGERENAFSKFATDLSEFLSFRLVKSGAFLT